MTSPNTQVNSKIQRVRLAHEANSRTCVSAAPRLAVLQELVALLVLCRRALVKLLLLGRLQAWEVLAGDAPALSRPGPPVAAPCAAE